MESKTPTLVLLKRNGIYLVVNGYGNGNDAYFYNEHTCPTNYMQDVEAVIYEKDADPHGVFEWVATIDKPEDWDCAPEEFEEWCKLFPELKHEDELPDTPLLTFTDPDTKRQSILFWNNGVLDFKGDVTSSARIFMDFLLETFNKWFESEIQKRSEAETVPPIPKEAMDVFDIALCRAARRLNQ